MSLLNNDSRAKVRGRGGRVVAGGWHSEGERDSEERREIERQIAGAQMQEHEGSHSVVSHASSGRRSFICFPIPC